MAEIVQRHSESTVREIEDLRQMKIFPEEVIRRIIAARKHMESRIDRNYSKSVDDFQKYITHEVMVLEKVRKCRDKKKVSEKKGSVEYSIIKRIRRLYESALQRFSNDYILHQSFFKFCKEHSFNSTASQVIDTMLKQFTYKPEVWKLAAGWYCHSNDVGKSLQVLRKGLTLNPESELLYSAAIEMELNQVTSAECDTQERMFKENKCSEEIKTYVTLILKYIKNLDYILSTLSILEGHNYTIHSQNLILDFCFQNHSKEDIVWHTLAKRESRGLHYVTDPNEKPRDQNFGISCLTYCNDKYQQGLISVDPEKKVKLWSHYLDTLIEMKKENFGGGTVHRLDLLKKALQQAHSENHLEEKLYSVWVDISSDDEARKILEEATNAYPKSEELWRMRFRYEIITDKVKKVESMFELAIKALEEKAINLWLMRLRFHQLISEDEKIKFIFEEGMKQPEQICNHLKPKYIEWIAFHEGIDAAREKYRNLAIKQPYCKELHILMSKLEFSEMNVNHERWKEVHVLACKQFGNDDVEPWINYVKWLIFRKADDFKDEIVKVAEEAEMKLPPLLLQDFNKIYHDLLVDS